MKLDFYAIENAHVDLRPNPVTREWMDHTAQSYAYRCLPLNIANSHGWSFHLPCAIAAYWDGGSDTQSLKIRAPRGHDAARIGISNFGHGILTFFIPGLFRTEPGWSLSVSGAPNMPLDGLYPLHGVVETDWAPYSFTMNWQVTRRNAWVTFPEGFPFCSVMPIKRDLPESIEPEMHLLKDNPDLHRAHEEWGRSRMRFNEDLLDPQSAAVQDKWQKTYYQGKLMDGSEGSQTHKIKLRTKKFKDLRGL